MSKKDNTLNKKSLFTRFFKDNSYCWLSVICTVGLVMLVYYCYDLFPFGEKTILRMDLYHQYGPLFAEFYDRVTNLKSFIYSWSTGLGSPFLGNYFNYLSSPSAIIILILGHENMPESIAGMVLVKAAFAAGAFTYYLKKSHGRQDFSTAAFGILYAMSGYFVAYYWNVMWIDAMVYFPLVMYGIERIINRRKPSVYIAFLALTLLSNYYMGYMTCIFSVIYFIVYYFSYYDFNTLADNTYYSFDEDGNKVYSLRHKIAGNTFLRSGFTFALGSLAAGCLVAFSLIPTFLILRSCSATSGTWPEGYKIYFDVFDFLANHLASVEPTIRSSGEDVLPNVYCGIATLILVPLYIFSKTVPLKEKIANIFALGILYFSFNINYLNYIWHGLHFPNDLPYRFSFMYVFLLLTIAYKAFIRLKEFTGQQILTVGVALVFFIILIQKTGSKNVDDMSLLLSLIFAVTYCLVFYILKDIRTQKSALAILLLCCVIGEVACADTDNFVMSQAKSNYTDDYDDFQTVKAKINELQGDEFCRMELTYNRARMDPAWFGYNGISTFSSMAYEKMSNVQSDLGLYSNYINSYTYHLQTPVYNMMHDLGYVINNDTNVTVENDYYTELFTEGKFTAYKNNYNMSIGVLASKDIGEWYTGYSNPFTVQGDWFEYVTGKSDVFSMMTIDDMGYYNVDEITSGLDTGDLYFNKSGSGEGDITVYLTVPEEKHCYLYVNSSAFEEITIEKNGESTVQSTDEAYIYDLGICGPEDMIDVLMTVEEDNDYGYIDFYPFYVNDDVLNEGYEVIKANQLNVESFEETKITGTITAEKASVLWTSIPYDKGWSVKIDGKEVEDEDIIPVADAYLAFNIAKGEHTVEISFKQRGLLEGAAISVFTLVVLLIFALIIKKRRPAREMKFANACIKAETDYKLMLEEKERAELLADEIEAAGEENGDEPVNDDQGFDESDVLEVTDFSMFYSAPAPENTAADEADEVAEETEEQTEFAEEEAPEEPDASEEKTEE